MISSLVESSIIALHPHWPLILATPALGSYSARRVT
uniref:Uncharacterized protein n=1 Tax=Anguilla anguilla TaxID=7936 RepID=A0A0E9SYV9_ANGAN